MIGIDVEKFAQIGESVRRGHCPTRKILPYGRLSDTEFLRDLGLSRAACFYCFNKSCSYLFECNHVFLCFIGNIRNFLSYLIVCADNIIMRNCGDGAAQDYAKAFYWFTKAVEQGLRTYKKKKQAKVLLFVFSLRLSDESRTIFKADKVNE